MKRGMYTMFFILFMGVICSWFTGCNGGIPNPPQNGGIPNPPQEKALVSDFVKSDVFLKALSSYEVESLKIDKRQTNKDVKTDVVYCTLVLKTASRELALESEMSYIYYDVGGWQLENADIRNTQYRLLKGAEKENIEPFFQEYCENRYYDYFDDFGIVSFDEETNFCIAKANMYRIEEYRDTISNVEIICSFNKVNGIWNTQEETEEKKYDYVKAIGMYEATVAFSNFYHEITGILEIEECVDEGVNYSITLTRPSSLWYDESSCSYSGYAAPKISGALSIAIPYYSESTEAWELAEEASLVFLTEIEIWSGISHNWKGKLQRIE